MKSCSNKHCQQQNPQPLDNFYSDSSRKDKLSARCKECHKYSSLMWQKNNKEKSNEKTKRFRAKNLEKTRESSRKSAKKWRESHPEEYKEKYSDRNLRYKYGITKEQYLNFCALQNNLCAICNNKEKLVVDHNHITGKTRKLLCNSCNIGLGFFKDKIQNLKNAITYLEDYDR